LYCAVVDAGIARISAYAAKSQFASALFDENAGRTWFVGDNAVASESPGAAFNAD